VYKLEAILKHLTPTTIAAMISDMDDKVMEEALTTDDVILMRSLVAELFALVDADALELLAAHGIDYEHPLVAEVIEENARK
jgi:hypothetical protein